MLCPPPSHKPTATFYVDCCLLVTAPALVVPQSSSSCPSPPASVVGLLIVVLSGEQPLPLLLPMLPTRHHHNHGRSVGRRCLRCHRQITASLSWNLFDCCVLFCHRVLSPSSSGGGHPAHRICHHRRRRCRGRRCHRCLCGLHRLCRHLTLPPHDLFDCCLLVLIPCCVVSP